jgi:hypothetical protein
VKYVVTNAKSMRKGTLIGFFDLEMPSGLIVRGVMLFEKNERRWCNLPSKEFTKQDGGKGYSPCSNGHRRKSTTPFATK